MDKSSANGGPPSYDTASDAAQPGTGTLSSTLRVGSGAAASALDSTDNGTIRGEDLPRGVTLKEATDPSSLYTFTKVSLELPFITATKRIAGPPAQSAPLPPLLLHCTLFATYDTATPHPVPFRQAGCPATRTRGQSSATPRTKVTEQISKLQKRLGVQIPLPYLGAPGFNPFQGPDHAFAYMPHPQPKNGAEMTARSGNMSRYRRVSLFQAQAKEMTGIVSRPLIERVVSAIYAGQGIYNRMALFPAAAVLRYSNKAVHADAESTTAAETDGEQKTGWFSRLKAKAKGKGSSIGSDNATVQQDGSAAGTRPVEQVRSTDGAGAQDSGTGSAVHTVKTAMVFATLDLLAPPPRLLETGGPYPVEMNKASDADLATSAKLINQFDRGTDEERFDAFFFHPSAADEQLFAEMLRALERRGAIWAEAGRLITPSSRNPNPRERPRFLVKGVFPERWVYRCRYYRARKFEPMPNDLDPKEVKRFGAPLIVHQVAERTGPEGIDLHDHLPHAAAASQSQSVADSQAALDWEWDDEDNLTFHSSAPTREDEAEMGVAPPPDYPSTQKELLRGYGIESQRAKALIEAEQDFFQGWSIGVTEEPFKNGGWMESLGTGSTLWFAASGL